MDLLLSYFITSYHLRDWLLRSGDVPQARMDELFRSDEVLRLCADLANIAKHYDLTDSPRREWQLSIAREYVGEGRGWFGRNAALVALSRGQRHDLSELAASCEASWMAFLIANGLMQNSDSAT
ncbi:MAG: hypothetical protein MUF00_09375 [Gemmatimonadaceae bacterium]|nr:hypothetical protein [Gemmatimonadaceae bacterium]